MVLAPIPTKQLISLAEFFSYILIAAVYVDYCYAMYCYYYYFKL